VFQILNWKAVARPGIRRKKIEEACFENGHRRRRRRT
jgi:hypothetical protein